MTQSSRLFSELLARCGLTKAQVARRLGVSYRTVIGWRETPPGYAVAYLELWIEYNRVRP